MTQDHQPGEDSRIPPELQKVGTASRQAGLAMELPFTLVAAVVLGGVVGYFLDRWLHTKPILMLIFGGLGFFAGIREVLRRLARSA